ncbi:putative protein G1-like7 [Iris pallida]|uniref:ALOG domain-containing protein n=1 Tax=Iris pallida TaxID=29817 RepID=A0AAX6EPH7_IRIPA|nr:putative protein G1-like7 [Iris pallida]
MDQGADAPGLGESPNPSPSSSFSSPAVVANTPVPTKRSEDTANPQQSAAAAAAVAASYSQPQPPSRYESQKRRDWNSFLQYLKNHKPSLALSRCSGAHVIEFLKYLDQFGKTKVHAQGCTYFGHPCPPAPCTCPLRQAWGSLDALIGRLRAAYEENGGSPDSNLFGAKAVRIYLREVRESQEKARGIPYEKKKRKRQTMTSRTAKGSPGSSSAAAAATVAAADDESSKKAAAAATRVLASGEETTKEGEESGTVPQQRDDLT